MSGIIQVLTPTKLRGFFCCLSGTLVQVHTVRGRQIVHGQGRQNLRAVGVNNRGNLAVDDLAFTGRSH